MHACRSTLEDPTLQQRLAPGGGVVSVRPLRGGVSSSVHAVRLEHADGTRRNVVVRTYGEEWANDPDVCGREFRLLEVLARRGYPAPEPLLLEADGALFGGPTIVMSRLRGRGMLKPTRLDRFVQQLVDALVQLHQVPLTDADFLTRRPPRVDRGPSRDDPIEHEVWAALRRVWRPDEQANPECVIHGDYWPGNTVWHRERLSGVIDWEMAQRGDPARDVATCRGDLAILFGAAAADDFTRRYEAARGKPINGLAFWNLYTVGGAMRYMEDWAVGYMALDRPDLDGPTARARLNEYARSLLRAQE